MVLSRISLRRGTRDNSLISKFCNQAGGSWWESTTRSESRRAASLLTHEFLTFPTLSAPWHNMAVSCCLGHRSFTFEESREKYNRSVKPISVTDCGSKIVENSPWVSVSKRARHRPFDLDSARLDWLHLSGFRFADYQHYLLQRLCYAYWNKTREISYKYSYSDPKSSDASAFLARNRS